MTMRWDAAVLALLVLVLVGCGASATVDPETAKTDAYVNVLSKDYAGLPVESRLGNCAGDISSASTSVARQSAAAGQCAAAALAMRSDVQRLVGKLQSTPSPRSIGKSGEELLHALADVQTALDGVLAAQQTNPEDWGRFTSSVANYWTAVKELCGPISHINQAIPWAGQPQPDSC